MQHFNWDGSLKKAYDKDPQSKKETRQKGMVSYVCDVCGKYHLGKSMKNKRKYERFLAG